MERVTTLATDAVSPAAEHPAGHRETPLPAAEIGQPSGVALQLCGRGEITLESTVGELLSHECTLSPAVNGQEVDELFRERPELPGVIIAEGSAVVAVISRQRWLEELSQPFRAELYLNHTVERAVAKMSTDYLLLGADTPVHAAADRALARNSSALFAPIVVNFGDGRHRLLDSHLLFMAQSRMFALSRERSDSLRQDVEAYARELEQTLAHLREAQNDLVEARRMAALARMVAGMSHEINTPVGIALTAVTHLEESIAGLKQTVQEGKLRRSEMERFLASAGESIILARANVQRAGELVRSFKRVAVDESSEARRQFDLANYLSEVILSLRPLLKRLPHQVVVDCPAGIALDSYPGALAQVLSNLMMNAVEHAFAEGQAGVISIECRKFDDSVEITFSDDGNGIPEADQEHLFEPFFTTRGNTGGSGLGLHIVFNLVSKVLKGTIACCSRPGHGTSFHIRIPLSATS